MSKSSTTSSSSKSPASQLSQRSAWAKGPPQTSNSSSSPRSQSPAPATTPTSASATHSRRPSTLGQGVPIKDGVSVPRNTVGAAKTGSAVSFGSIDGTSSNRSSSPAVASPTVKTAEGVKSFGTVPATVGSQINGKSPVTPTAAKPITQSSSQQPSSSTASSAGTSTTPSTPASSKMKMDIKKLFQNPSTPSSQTPSDTSSPSIRSAALPPQPPPSGQPIPPSGSSSQMGFTPFVPQNGMRNQPQNPAGQGPRSPVYPRQMPNGNAPRPNGNGPPPSSQMNAALGSPRLAPPTQPNQMPPPPQMGMPWQGYYYPPMPPDAQYMPYPPWGYPMQSHPGMPQQQPPPQMHHPPQPSPHQQPPHPSMPISPRNPPHQLQPQQPPGTPTHQHATVAHPPPPLSHSHSSSTSISSISSPPATPSTARLNTNANAFVPGGAVGSGIGGGAGARKIVKITTADGNEVQLDKYKHHHTPSTTSVSPSPVTTGTASPSRKGIKIEDPKEKEKERKAKEEAERKARESKEAEERAKKEAEAEKKAAEQKKKDEERKKEEERKRKEEEELKKKEAEERKKKEAEEEKRKKEAEEKKKKEAEEKAEKERIQREEEERARKQEEARKKREEEEKEKERVRQEEEAKAKREAEEKSKQEEAIKAEDKGKGDEIEDGEIEETKDEKKKDEKKSLKIDTQPEPFIRKRPGPLDLSGTSKPIAPPLPSALATARIIDDLGSVPYPEGVKSPKIELNVNAQAGKFRYDRDFLLQFMSICKEKPDSLPPLDAIGLEPADPSSFSMSRGGSGRHRTTSGATPTRSASIGLGFGTPASFGKSSGSSFGGMGNFGTTPGSKLTSEERFQLANGVRAASVSGATGMQFTRPGQLQRTASQGGPGSMDSRRTRSKRGDKRPDSNKQASQQHGSAFGNHANAQPPLEPVAPLQATANRWDRKALGHADQDSPEVVDRKVKGLLNKITMEKFDSISDQIITWANKSEKEKDGRTLIQVIRLVFEKATDEAAFSEMYARLCRKMMEQISPQVQDEGIKNNEGRPIAGGQLFRKYLLNRCQEDFERGWVAKEATAAAAASKSKEDQAAAKANAENKEGEGDGEVALYSDEYYAAQKAKRQGLGLIKFIGELFKLQMLTERIMHECVKKLLGNVENPEEEEIESLCKLLTTVGQILDTTKAKAHMDVYFFRMKELTKSQNVSSRMQFMLQDVIELRERKWISRNAVAAPTTIAKVHEAAAKEKANQEAYRTISMSRSGSRRGADRAEVAQNPDGWTTAGGNAPRPPTKAGDLSKFGQINKGAPITFGPSSVFAGKKESKRESLSRSSSNANMFQMLQNVDTLAEPPSASKGSRPPSRKASIDLSHGEAPQRRKLVLQPRSKPLESEASARTDSAQNSDAETEEPEAETEMSEAEAKKKIEEDSKEFFGVRNLEEAEVYFEKLPSVHHRLLVDKLVSIAVESKDADAQLVGDLFARASSKGLCSAAAFVEAFSSIAEFLDDIVYDAPKAPNLFAIMLKGVGLSDEQRTQITSKSDGNGQKVFELSS